MKRYSIAIPRILFYAFMVCRVGNFVKIDSGTRMGTVGTAPVSLVLVACGVVIAVYHACQIPFGNSILLLRTQFTVTKSIDISRARTVIHLPPVGLGRIAIAQDAVEGSLDTGIETLDKIGIPWLVFFGEGRHSVVVGQQLLSIEEVGFGLVIGIIKRHSPTGLYTDAGYLEVPSHAT